MEIREAIAETEKNLWAWKLNQKDGWTKANIEYNCAIPIAEALLSAARSYVRQQILMEGVIRASTPIAPKPPDKPPGIKANDWVSKDGWTKPMQVMERRSDTTLTMWHCGHIVRDEDVRVYRRSDAPLQEGDRGLLGNVEVWVDERPIPDGRIRVEFRGEPYEGEAEYAWIDRSRFTLTEPVYPDGEKLSGKEKED